MRQHTRSHGFTLIEVMIAMAIVAILAAVAVPLYNRYVVEALLPDAFNSLTTLAQNLESFKEDNSTYVGACQAGTNAPLPTSSNWTFSCPTLSATGYVVQANGVAGSQVAGFSFTLDSSGNEVTLSTPSGWTNPGSCWVRSPSGSCS
jgi:type IV pilus assembly protein PilE